MPWAAGGVGGAHILAEPGELEVEVFKRDLEVRDRGVELRAMLLGPDREILDKVVFPRGEGSSGAVQREVLRADVDYPGVYALSIADLDDRHGLNVAWGMRTNAGAYVVETSRGHRDEEHVEPIVLVDADSPADVTFLPRQGAFEIEVEGLPPGVEELTLYDDAGEVAARIPVEQERSTAIRSYLRLSPGDEPEGSATYTVPADEDRGREPWTLHFPKGKAFVNIGGLTQWQSGDPYEHLATWTPEPKSWFPFLEYRWLITPYQRTVWEEPGEEGQVIFRVHNNGLEPRVMTLELEFPDAEWTAALREDRVTLEPGESREVEVTFTAPGEGGEQTCHVRVVPEQEPDMTAYATLTVRGGEAPADRPLDMPLVLKPYAHENWQFGYMPDYPTANQPYFDRENRPYVVAGGELHRRIDGEWEAVNLSEAVTRVEPEFDARRAWSAESAKLAFDADNGVYLLASSGDRVALLHSEDRGESFTAYVIEGREGEGRSWDIEQFSGHNIPEGPPPIVRFTQTHLDDPDVPTGRRDPRVRWRRVNDLELFVPERTADGRIELGEPMFLSDMALGSSMHSGIPSSVVSRGAKTHVVWGEATDPGASTDDIPGVPAYVASYDRETGELGEPVFMSFGPPPNDVHNTPSIVMDGEGHLHVVVGTHGRPFQYLRSLEPNDPYGGWTDPVRTSEEDLRQTYVGLVSGADDALHLVFREWRSGEAFHDGRSWPSLSYQRKPAGEDWEEPKSLVVPPWPMYGIYYHRLTVDQEGALFLSYDYWSTMWFYRNDRRPGRAGPGRGWGRAVLTSDDGGDSWRLW